MKINGKVKIKDSLTRNDVATITENIASAVIFKDDDGIIYQPYLFDDATKMAVALTALEGVEFEDNDVIIDIVENDGIINKLVNDYISSSEDMVEVIGYAYDLIDFRKELYLKQNDELDALLKKAVEKENALNDILLEVARAQNKVLNQQAKSNELQEEIFSQLSKEELVSMQKRFANGEFDVDSMINMAIEKYVENDKDRDRAYKEIIDEKNKKIIELSSKVSEE